MLDLRFPNMGKKERGLKRVKYIGASKTTKSTKQFL